VSEEGEHGELPEEEGSESVDPSPPGPQEGGNGSQPSPDSADASPAPGSMGDGLELEARTREGALEKLKRALAEREVPTPQLEGYPLHKARKILELTGIDPARLKLRLTDSVEDRGRVLRQFPMQGDMLDLDDDKQPVELTVAERSPLGFLPGLYQRTDLTGRNFVHDFLWITTHLQFQTEEKLDNLEHYFDPHECPPEFLDYLASWVALSLESDWPEFKRRSLIKKAVELYHLRGTPRGLRVYLRIFTGVDPVIIENAWPFDGVVVGISSTVGEDMVLMHAVNRAHTFVVHIPLPIDDVDDDMIRRIHRIIEQEKPVHTDYYLTFAEPEEESIDTGLVVGVSSTIGVDTWVEGDAAAYETYYGADDGMESASES
jgi:phage tail-like protein